MPGQSDINAQIFDRIEKVENNVESISSAMTEMRSTMAEMRGMVSASMKGQDKMISLLGKTIWALVFLLFLFAGAVIYGAVGEKGLKSVRDTLPTMPRKAYPMANLPDPLDKWTNGIPQTVK